MSKKPKRGSPTIDMTAMVDVAFLLLTFFILTTTKFREDQSVEVDTPSSVSEMLPPGTQLMTVAVDRDGKVFVGFSDIETRRNALLRAADEKGFEVTEAGLNYFSSLEDFGVTFDNDSISQWLELSNEERGEYTQNGMHAIVLDTLTERGNDVKDWVRLGRLSDPRMRFAIKGDGNAPYQVISDVISSLQEWDVNQFSLLTDLEEGEEGADVAKKRTASF